MTTITVEIKNIYGVEKVYPHCDIAKKLTALTGCITLTAAAISLIKSLGYKITVKQKEF